MIKLHIRVLLARKWASSMTYNNRSDIKERMFAYVHACY